MIFLEGEAKSDHKTRDVIAENNYGTTRGSARQVFGSFKRVLRTFRQDVHNRVVLLGFSRVIHTHACALRSVMYFLGIMHLDAL